MLVRNTFDFQATAKEFQRHLNSNQLADSSSNVFFKIDPKTLQLKWTDIEIRKHVIPGLKDQEEPDEEDDEELPPLEKPSSEEVEKEMRQKQVNKLIDENSEPSTSEEQSPEKDENIASAINK